MGAGGAVFRDAFDSDTDNRRRSPGHSLPKATAPTWSGASMVSAIGRDAVYGHAEGTIVVSAVTRPPWCSIETTAVANPIEFASSTRPLSCDPTFPPSFVAERRNPQLRHHALGGVGVTVGGGHGAREAVAAGSEVDGEPRVSARRHRRD